MTSHMTSLFPIFTTKPRFGVEENVTRLGGQNKWPSDNQTEKLFCIKLDTSEIISRYIVTPHFSVNYTLNLISLNANLFYLSKRYDHPHILAGAGTMGLEIMEQVKNVDAVIIPVGGGGLIAGVAVAVKTLSPDTKIIVSSITNHFTVSIGNHMISSAIKVVSIDPKWPTDQPQLGNTRSCVQIRAKHKLKTQSQSHATYFHCGNIWNAVSETLFFKI